MNKHTRDAKLLSEAYTQIYKENLAPKHPEHAKVDIKDTADLEVGGVDARDYPDFVDAYFTSGYHTGENRDLTEDELNYLSDNYPEELNREAHEHYMATR